ncbi:MAG TPA: hypothetical protein VJT13_15580 [Xanthobacteraceae bacterium]|nr:hypothetical protein [Xanthobacteraceae bacterium]
MRTLAPLGVVVASLLLAGAAGAENRTFIIPNNPDGYGIDRCLANGERCGAVVATTYCQSQSFAQARSFRRIDRDEITGAASSSRRNACVGNCESFVAIECTR